ncbi:hypothetical protein M6B38_346525 [Iris pallida]|uniref:Uncharacterized protein n=1 Tax=Iris pallida TaxID=29817 RepID=A0AAX6GUW9_IRIPA|nr:hypothetical protein M6B38_346525 [Iris pallida]
MVTFGIKKKKKKRKKERRKPLAWKLKIIIFFRWIMDAILSTCKKVIVKMFDLLTSTQMHSRNLN